MSNKLSGLLSATFAEPAYDHLVELVHQRDAAAHRRLASVRMSAHDPSGREVLALDVDPAREIFDLGAALGARSEPRVMVLFDARYDEAIFPYRPHHYAYLHARGATDAPLYYAVNATLGGVPDRIGATNINNVETYVFRPRAFAERYSVMLGNVSRFAIAQAQVLAYYGAERIGHQVELPPKAHVETALAAERAGVRLSRVETKAPFRLASYVVGRHAESRQLVLFDHLFTYAK
jgi:hypothetical protein